MERALDSRYLRFRRTQVTAEIKPAATSTAAGGSGTAVENSIGTKNGSLVVGMPPPQIITFPWKATSPPVVTYIFPNSVVSLAAPNAVQKTPLTPPR